MPNQTKQCHRMLQYWYRSPIYVCHLSLCKHQVPSVIAINGVSHFDIFRLCGFVYDFPVLLDRWDCETVSLMTTVQPIDTRYLMAKPTYSQCHTAPIHPYTYSGHSHFYYDMKWILWLAKSNHSSTKTYFIKLDNGFCSPKAKQYEWA